MRSARRWTRPGFGDCGSELAAKYASAFYGPFREAAEGAPKFGDRRSYQLDPANGGEALREVALDVAEGADMVMVKPALAYLDMIRRSRRASPCRWRPTRSAASSHDQGGGGQRLAGPGAGIMETLTAIRRAGAGIILTYWAAEVARWLQS